MKHRAGGLLTAIFGLLAACSTGPMDVRLEPPAVKVDSLRIENGRVHLGLHMHNRNDHELLLQSAAIAMRVNDIELLDSVRALELDISPRGRELVHLDAPALPGGAQLLTGLETSPGASIEFELSSDIAIDGQKNATSVEQGFLFPVPDNRVISGERRPLVLDHVWMHRQPNLFMLATGFWIEIRRL